MHLHTGAHFNVPVPMLPPLLAQRGEFAAHTLSHWPSCTKYILVDLWAMQVAVAMGCVGVRQGGSWQGFFPSLTQAVPASLFQVNYDDVANVDNQAQEGIMNEAKAKLDAWKDKVKIGGCLRRLCLLLPASRAARHAADTQRASPPAHPALFCFRPATPASVAAQPDIAGSAAGTRQFPRLHLC